MRFKIVSVGWECSEFLERTLASIKHQDWSDYDVMVIDDASEDPRQAPLIGSICKEQGWGFHINERHRGQVWNQYQAIWLLDPKDDDVVVWLDLDGDRFAHPGVLEILALTYEVSDVLLTYGNYRPEPDFGTCPPAIPFPEDVVATNSYREFIRTGGCNFNHLRTMKGRVANAITPELLSWSDGSWYEAGADYAYMVNGLELAGGRYRCMDEVLCIYNNANPRADNLTHPELTNRCVWDMLGRTPLEPVL